MKRAIALFFKQKTTIIGIVLLLFFQLVFGLVWMNGYDGVTTRTTQLGVGILNEDEKLGKQIADNLMKTLPFKMEKVTSEDDAKAKLDARDLKMVIRIPADFSQKAMQPGEHVQVGVMVNESNPTLIKSISQQVLDQVTAKLNEQMNHQGVQMALVNMKVPQDRAEGIAKSLTDRVEGQLISQNKVSNFSYSMLPMAVVLSTFVGSMLLTMQLTASATALREQTTPWQRFFARQLINILAAVTAALVLVLLVWSFNVEPVGGYGALTGFLMLSLLSFLSLAQVFVFLFGEAGMLFNIIALSTQLVTSGVMVPRELLSDAFQTLGNMLPASYSATGLLNLLFGGSGTGDAVTGLALEIAITLAVTLLVTGVQGIFHKKKVSDQKVVA